jgi:DNA-binding GntR family transcriptional regulator
VREALRQLAAEGLVTLTPRVGAVVARPSAEDVEEIFSLRYALEGLAVRTLARTATPEDRRALERVLAHMRRALGRGDAGGYARWARQFHHLVVERSGNRRLVRIYRTLHAQIHRFRRRSLGDRRALWRSYRDHLAIARAVARGDAEGAERRLRDHLTHVADALVGRAVAVRLGQWRA